MLSRALLIFLLKPLFPQLSQKLKLLWKCCGRIASLFKTPLIFKQVGNLYKIWENCV